MNKEELEKLVELEILKDEKEERIHRLKVFGLLIISGFLLSIITGVLVYFKDTIDNFSDNISTNMNIFLETTPTYITIPLATFIIVFLLGLFYLIYTSID